MAIALESGHGHQRWRGLSTDEKPGLNPVEVGGSIPPMPAGSTFTELDTGDIYIWNGAAPWVLQQQAQVEVKVRDVIAILEEFVDLQKRMLFALTEGGWDLDYEELMTMELPNY